MADDKKKAAAGPAKKKDVKKKNSKAYKPGKSCPRCGAGVKLAEHKDRRACGKCGYFEKK